MTQIADIKHTVHLSSDASRPCQHCDETFSYGPVAAAANHYIQTHGYVLLHVGSEHATDSEGATVHHTVFVLGHVSPPAQREPAQIIVGGQPLGG